MCVYLASVRRLTLRPTKAKIPHRSRLSTAPRYSGLTENPSPLPRSLSPRQDLLRPQNTVVLIKFASRRLIAKVHLKKNPEVEKLEGIDYCNKRIPYTIYRTVESMVGLPDPARSIFHSTAVYTRVPARYPLNLVCTFTVYRYSGTLIPCTTSLECRIIYRIVKAKTLRGGGPTKVYFVRLEPVLD